MDASNALAPLLTLSNVSGIRLFSDRFKCRILEMAARDIDLPTRLASLECVNQLCQLDLLDEGDAKWIIPCLFDIESKVRESAAPMLVKLVEEQKGDIETDQPGFQDIKALCQLFVQHMASDNDRHGRKPREQNEDDLDFEEEAILHARQKDQKQLIEWFSAGWKASHLSFGSFGMDQVVASLWSMFPLVKVLFLRVSHPGLENNGRVFVRVVRRKRGMLFVSRGGNMPRLPFSIIYRTISRPNLCKALIDRYPNVFVTRIDQNHTVAFQKIRARLCWTNSQFD